MNKKLITITTLAAVVVLFAGWSLLAKQETSSASDIRLVGQMERFQLADTAKQSPDVSWFDLNGKKITLSDFEGRVVLINYWATWCAPCLQELPSVNRLQAKLAGDDFTVVAINIDRNAVNTAAAVAKDLQLDALEIYIDARSASARKLGVRGMPTTFLIDRQGRLIGHFEGGAEWDEPESVSLVQYFIDHPNYLDQLLKVSG